jgi:hypothetical protein
MQAQSSFFNKRILQKVCIYLIKLFFYFHSTRQMLEKAKRISDPQDAFPCKSQDVFIGCCMRKNLRRKLAANGT